MPATRSLRPARFAWATLCLGLAAACSTPSATSGYGFADTESDGPGVVFDPTGAKADAGKIDSGKADTNTPDAVAPTPDAAAADTTHTDAEVADVAKDVVDIEVSAPDVQAPDVVLDDDSGPDATTPDADDAEADAAIADATTPTPFGHLCDPCSTDAACNDDGGTGNLCIATDSDGSFCGIACDPTASSACPDFYSCESTAGGAPQCRPTSGVCTCSVAAAIAKLSTPCAVSSALGTCMGTRSCGVSGLGKCTAPTPGEEICNGADDNCDGKTDEGLCGGNACLAGTCDAITGVCAPAVNGTACDDKNNCTTTDGCSNGTCVGSSASDGNDASPGTALAKKSDCDGSSNTKSILAPGSDVDWFTFTASDDTLCSIYPSVRVDQMAGDYDVCVYFACKDGKSSSSVVGCDKGAKVSNGPNGAWGCCSANAGLGAEHVQLNTTCSTLGLGNDGGTLSIEVTAHAPNTANICGGYTLTWSATSL
jgi:hypothetical protein